MFVKWIFSAKKSVDKHKETVPAKAETESRRKEAENTHKIPAISTTPAEIPPAVNSPVSVPPLPKISASAPAPQNAVAQTTPPPIKKKFITREVMETIFQRGARGLTRIAAVAALRKLGFGKSAAYDALLEDGRFSAWLRFAPDGIITWTEH
jgi:hypothetical protein